MPVFKSHLSLPLPCYVNLACCYLLCILVFTCKIENNISLPPEVAIKHMQVFRTAGSIQVLNTDWLFPTSSPQGVHFPQCNKWKCTGFRFRQIGIWMAILPLAICGRLKYCLFSPHLSSLILNTGMTFALYGDTVLWFFLHLVIQRGLNESLLLCLVASQGLEVGLAV